MSESIETWPEGAEIRAEACMATPEFAAVFEDSRDLLLALFDSLVRELRLLALRRYAEHDRWLDGVRSVLDALLDWFERHPGLARFLFAGSLGDDATLSDRRDRVLAELAAGLEAEAPPSTDREQAPFGGDAVVGATAAVLHGRLLDDHASGVTDLAPALMALIVLPYLDVGAAREEIGRPPHQLSDEAGG